MDEDVLATDVVRHPVTEYGTTRCPNEGWVAAEIDDEDGCCWACGEVVVPPRNPPGSPTSAGADRG